jgi:hypothetical protein
MARCTLTAAERASLDDLTMKLDLAKDELREALGQIVNKWQEQLDDATPNWSDSDPGQEAQDRLMELQSVIDALDSLEVTIP